MYRTKRCPMRVVHPITCVSGRYLRPFHLALVESAQAKFALDAILDAASSLEPPNVDVTRADIGPASPRPSPTEQEHEILPILILVLISI
jgi:hypothetical protein